MKLFKQIKKSIYCGMLLLSGISGIRFVRGCKARLKIGFYGLIVVLIGIMPACVSVKPPESKVSEYKHANFSYTGPTATVGSPMIQFQDFYYAEIVTPKYRALNDFKIVYGAGLQKIRLNASRGQLLNSIGETEIEGVKYGIMEIGRYTLQGAPSGILVDSSGNLLEEGIFVNGLGRWQRTGKSFLELTPSSAKVEKSSSLNIDLDRGYSNFELIYQGRAGDIVSVLYREYTPSDGLNLSWARDSFFQQIQYDLSSSNIIRFKDIVIKVQSADNERIVYSTIEFPYKADRQSEKAYRDNSLIPL